VAYKYLHDPQRVLGRLERLHDTLDINTIQTQRLRASHDAGSHQRRRELRMKLYGKSSLTVPQYLVWIVLGVP
jgi:hypothetical protein